MKIVNEISLENFEAWSGAIRTLDRVRNAGLCDALEAMLEDMYPDGMTKTELNDLLWFDDDTVYEWLGMRTESQIREEIEEAKERLAQMEEDYEDAWQSHVEEVNEQRDMHGMNPLDDEEIESIKTKIWDDYYEADADELRGKIAELNEELNEL